MPPSPTISQASTSTGSSAGQSPKQEALINFCRSNGYRAPAWQIVSDRRGGRTAWSCTVTIGGQQIPARFWYDGQYVNNAREDAAERALQALGQMPAPPTLQPAHYQQQQRTYYGGGAAAVGGEGFSRVAPHAGALGSDGYSRVVPQ